MFLKLSSYFAEGKNGIFCKLQCKYKQYQSLTFSANKNSASTISKPPAQKLVCYMMSVMSLLVSVVSQTKGKEEKQFPLQTMNL